jgi:predicted transposase/invertase (TIGR01784 family)
MQFLDPRNDVAFKKIFGSEAHKEITISFLNSILEYKGTQAIVDVQFLNTEQNPFIPGEKKENFLDILCTDQAENRYIVEMQVDRVKEFGKRMVYYATKTYAMQLGQGRSYRLLKPVIIIAILDHTMFYHKASYKSIHKILDDKTYECDLPELVFAFVELEKFTKKENDLVTNEDKWLYFIKWIGDQTRVPTPLGKEEFAQACRAAERMTWSEYELAAYEKAIIRETDKEGAMELAEERGVAKGLAKGKDKAINEVVLKMLTCKMDINTIASVTGMSVDRINELKKGL